MRTTCTSAMAASARGHDTQSTRASAGSGTRRSDATLERPIVISTSSRRGPRHLPVLAHRRQQRMVSHTVPRPPPVARKRTTSQRHPGGLGTASTRRHGSSEEREAIHAVTRGTKNSHIRPRAPVPGPLRTALRVRRRMRPTSRPPAPNSKHDDGQDQRRKVGHRCMDESRQRLCTARYLPRQRPA